MGTTQGTRGTRGTRVLHGVLGVQNREKTTRVPPVRTAIAPIGGCYLLSVCMGHDVRDLGREQIVPQAVTAKNDEVPLLQGRGRGVGVGGRLGWCDSGSASGSVGVLSPEAVAGRKAGCRAAPGRTQEQAKACPCSRWCNGLGG